jgi:tetratricopeptide (TPR) repeat protein
MLEIDEYLQRADAARQRGDWQSVATQLAQAINHPDLLGKGPQRSAIHLACGRAVGVFCQYAEAEKFLLMARDIARESGSPSFDAVLELGSLHLAQGDFVHVIGYLEPLARAAAAPDGPKPPPPGLARLHELLAEALSGAGRSQDAASNRQQARILREASPTGTSPSRCD